MIFPRSSLRELENINLLDPVAIVNTAQLIALGHATTGARELIVARFGNTRKHGRYRLDSDRTIRGRF